ncbi:hypothetical protein BTO04_02140 [Polaribacter sp. SA4-10]|uniref:hypothetical protein n=1 Tax=Polaribacter sp. SA4-10 TaxID=754397 RepID=UPI000B3CC892|nr:hypothetical protein [Polaribacter sp. SA4-10]ARV05569.1 hypothetical protein BTO04_02140 [Polaribacter sp. SA4-10]
MKNLFWLLNISYKRHRLLKYLALRNIEYWQKQKGFTNPYMSFDEICEKLKWNKTELDIIYIQLEKELEIKQSVEKADNILTITAKGILSYSNRKYFNFYSKSIIVGIKDLAQIFIPVASLIIAFLALTYSNPKIQKIEYKKELNNIEINIDSLKTQMKEIKEGIIPLQKNNLTKK